MKIAPFSVTATGVGRPDYSTPIPLGQAPVGPVFTLTDLAELAARLGSINTFDRRGNVIWYDDFEDNINKWYQHTVGTGGAIALSTEAARNGALSAKLTTGDADGDTASISHQMPFPVLARLGAEISFTLDVGLDKVEFQLSLFDGTTHYAGFIVYYQLAAHHGELYYADILGAEQLIASGLDLRENIYHFHTIKLVVDFINHKYERLILDNVTYDLSAHNCYHTPLVISPHAWFLIVVTNQIAGNHSIHVDDAIVTQQEPKNIPAVI